MDRVMHYFVFCFTNQDLSPGPIMMLGWTELDSIDYDESRDRRAFRLVASAGGVFYSHDLRMVELYEGQDGSPKLKEVDIQQHITSNKCDLSFLAY